MEREININMQKKPTFKIDHLPLQLMKNTQKNMIFFSIRDLLFTYKKII